MAKFEVEQNGQRYEVEAPDGTSVQDIIGALKRTHGDAKPEPGMGEQFWRGFKNVTTGITQGVEHLLGKERFDAVNKWLETKLGPEFGQSLHDVPGNSGEDYDEYVKRRKAVNEEKFGTGFSLAETAGEMVALAPFTPARLLAARPLVGATALGGISGAAQPVTNPEEGYWGEKLGQTVLGGAEGFGLGVGGKAIGSAVNRGAEALAKKFSLPDIEKYLNRKNRSRIQTALTNTLAKGEIAKRMASDKAGGGLSQAQLLALVREANANGIPMTMADFADPELAGLIGNLTRVPGPARTRIRRFLEDRDIKEGQYLTGMVRRFMHGTSDTAYRTGKALIAKQAADAAPLYEKVAKHPGVMSDKLRVMLNTNALRGALKPGIEFETNMAAAEGKAFDPIGLGLIADEEGNFAMPSAPQLRVLDIAKKGLDAMISAERNEVTGRLSQRGLGLDHLRRAFLEEIDRLDTSGIYKAARDAWGGPAASLDALKLGRAVFTNHPEEFAELMSGLSPANRDFVRVGAADAMIERILKTGMHGDEAKQMVRSQWVRNQIQPLFESGSPQLAEQKYNAFIREIDYATKRFETKRKYMGGSQTGERIAEDTSEKINRMSTVAAVMRDLVHQNHFGAVRHIYRYFRDVGFTPDEKLNDAIAKMVLTFDEAGAKRRNVPERFNLKRIQNPFPNAGGNLTRILNQIAVPAAATNQPEQQ